MLSKEVRELSSTLLKVQEKSTPDIDASPHDSNKPMSFSAAVHHVQNKNLPPRSSMPSLSRLSVSDDEERNLNIVVSGIPECKEGQSRKQSWISDLQNTSKLFCESDTSPAIPPSSIRDCRRLGKYSPENSRPRSILVRFNSCNVVMNILSKRSTFTPYIIKPDLPPNIRLREKILLKERWNLMQSGTNKSSIKIKGNSLFVNGSPFGSVQNSVFVRSNESELSDINSSSTLSGSIESEPSHSTDQQLHPEVPSTDPTSHRSD